MKHILICILTMVALSGCAGALPWNDQNKAGSESVSIQYFESSQKVKSVTYEHWKETEASTALIWLADGTRIELEAKGTKAFDAIRQRAGVEKAVMDQIGEVAPGVVDAIIKALKGGTP